MMINLVRELGAKKQRFAGSTQSTEKVWRRFRKIKLSSFSLGSLWISNCGLLYGHQCFTVLPFFYRLRSPYFYSVKYGKRYVPKVPDVRGLWFPPFAVLLLLVCSSQWRLFDSLLTFQMAI